MLTVGELRKVIESLPAEMVVIVTTDTEGSRYAHVAGYGLGYAHDADVNSNRLYQPVGFLGEDECAEITLPLNCICLGP